MGRTLALKAKAAIAYAKIPAEVLDNNFRLPGIDAAVKEAQAVR
jgi:hypothetical protein